MVSHLLRHISERREPASISFTYEKNFRFLDQSFCCMSYCYGQSGSPGNWFPTGLTALVLFRVLQLCRSNDQALSVYITLFKKIVGFTASGHNYANMSVGFEIFFSDSFLVSVAASHSD